MIEENTCPKCGFTYEIVYDTDAKIIINHYNHSHSDLDDDEDEFIDDETEDELVPRFCPFCGLDRIYGSDDDLEEG